MRIADTAIASLALLLAGCASAPVPPFEDGVARAGDVRVVGELESVERAPACGILLLGSPVTYRIVSGPDDLRGRRVRVLVACIEMPLAEGDVKSFDAGAIHDLVLTRSNLHRVEVPALPEDPAWFYLKSASLSVAAGEPR